MRRHLYGIHDGLIGHHTQLPPRRPRGGTAADSGSTAGGTDGIGSSASAAVRAAGGIAETVGGEGTAEGSVADDQSEGVSSQSPSSRARAPASLPVSDESGSTAHSAVESQLRTLLELTRILVPSTDTGGATANAVPEYLYSSVGLHVRALYEALGDARRAEPLVPIRKRAKTSLFNTVRLRALQRFVLQVGGAGLSEKDQAFRYDFPDVWDGTKAGMAEDAAHHATLRHAFPSVKAFKNALRDDLDDAALKTCWKKVKLVEGGVTDEACFRDVLQVLWALMRKKRSSIQLWSGVPGPAPPSDKRDSPMDGDAFRLGEELVMKNRDERA